MVQQLMCGIYGIISENSHLTADLVESGLSLLAHRGPDDKGVFLQGPVAFGHRRLSIIDLALGHQPMCNADKSLCITFNGEIYNHLQLRENLSEKGYIFRTSSDTETLLAAYSEWGIECLDHLRGMYAFALADFSRKHVFLARDMFGIKPLIYRQGPGVLAFASEIPALRQLSILPASEIDKEAVALFFRYQFIPAPHTIFCDIRKLKPAHAMLASFNGKIKQIWRHHTFSFAPNVKDKEVELEERVDAVIADSVAAHTLSDVPLGVFLSGGIDSTLIALNLVRAIGQSIPAFTISFSEEDYSELRYAEIAAKHLGLRLHATTLGEDCLEKLPVILSHYGEPYGDSSVLPTWHVGDLARQHVPVVLSGDGGDELFGGYHSHAAWMQYSKWKVIRSVLRAALELRPRVTLKRLISMIRQPEDKKFWHQFIQYNTPESIKALLKPEYHCYSGSLASAFSDFDELHPTYSRLDMAQLFDLMSYQPDCLLPKVDVTSMFHGLEVRPAFLDKHVWQLASTLPEKLRFNAKEGGKAVLKRILAQNGFSDSFVYRYKQGFALPRQYWFLPGRKARLMLEDLLLQKNDTLSEYCNLDEVKRIINIHSDSVDMSGQLWLVLSFLCWLHNEKA